jgi:hypothetical protein
LNIFRVSMTWKEMMGGQVKVEATTDEEAAIRAVEILTENGCESIEIVEVEFVGDAAEVRKGMN